jgi:Family of unknown function (DUF6807)
MKKRTSRSLLAVAGAAVMLAGTVLWGQEPVTLQRRNETVAVRIGGTPFTTYYFGPQSPKPYLHPLRSAQGTIVTRGWPMVKNIPGEDHDHPHHRAMFFAHGDINGIDFWGEQTLSKKAETARGVYYSSEELPKGRTVFRRMEEARGGAHKGVIRADFDLVGPDSKAIGEETQAYTFRGSKTQRVIDCEFTLRANHGPLKLGDTKEGTFAIRVVHALNSPPGHMVNSQGARGEKDIWGKKADWVDYYGDVKGEEVGIAIFDNPGNLRHPTTWHARGYGLFAVNPFGLHDFDHNAKIDGSYTIPAGGSLTLRYRVLIHHGDDKQAGVAQAYRRYAEGE